MSGSVFEVPGQRRRDIRELAGLVRRLAERELRFRGPYFPILDVLEVLLPKLDTEFVFGVRDGEQMGDCHGMTIPSQHTIILRSDVYERAWAGQGRDRATAAHELGHYLLHADVALPRKMRSREEIPPYRSSEWQANCFAGELLVCPRFCAPTDTPQTIAKRFGVSLAAADKQLHAFRKEGLA